MPSLKPERDSEAQLYDFECNIDLLDRLIDSLIDDRMTANALTGLRGNLERLYEEFADTLRP